MNIYVYNLSSDITNADLENLFTTYGEVFSVAIEKDASSGRSHGIGHIHMPIEAQAKNAINGLHGIEINGKEIMVYEEGNTPRFQTFT